MSKEGLSLPELDMPLGRDGVWRKGLHGQLLDHSIQFVNAYFHAFGCSTLAIAGNNTCS